MLDCRPEACSHRERAEHCQLALSLLANPLKILKPAGLPADSVPPAASVLSVTSSAQPARRT